MSIKYKWLAEELEQTIQKCMSKGTSRLPTEKELCESYHVSRQTVRMALQLLEERGLITRRQGSGIFLTGRSPKQDQNHIAVLISNDQDYIYPSLLTILRQIFQENHFPSDIYVTENQVSKEREILTTLLKAPPRGLLVEGCKSALPNPNLYLYLKLQKRGCAIVFLFNHYPALSDSLYVKDDNYNGSAMLVEHLISLGHTNIGGIFKSDDQQGLERYLGFVETMYNHHLSVSDEHICLYNERDFQKLTNPVNYESRNSSPDSKNTVFLERMILENLSDCTALVCYNDQIAYPLIHILRKNGYHLPEDMALCSFDNTYLSHSHALKITSLSHKQDEMARRAAETLLQKIKGLPVTRQIVPWSLSIKESSRHLHDTL